MNNNKKMVFLLGEEYIPELITIERVKETPTIQIKYRKKMHTLHCPQIGSIIAIEHNGYGTTDDTYVVLEIEKTRKGIPKKIKTKRVKYITDDTVTFDEKESHIELKTIWKQSGVVWNQDMMSTRISYSTFDKYVPYYFDILK